MKYNIVWSERKETSGGKKMIKATLKDDKGVEFTDVAIWDSFPNFEGIMTGHDIEGDLVVKQNGQYENKSLYPLKVSTGGSIGANRGGVARNMEVKNENIKQSQDRKEHSIKESSSIRDSVQLALAEFNADSNVNLEERIFHWRKFLLSNWDLPF